MIWQELFAKPSTVKGDDLEDELRWHTLHNHSILKKAGIDKVIIGGKKPVKFARLLGIVETLASAEDSLNLQDDGMVIDDEDEEADEEELMHS
jgi:hypothetical protein